MQIDRERPMSGDRVDVLEAFDDLRQFAHPHLTAIEDFARFSNARARIAELIEAADAYATGYMQDEAEDDPKWFVCGAEQRKAAQRVFAALAACREGGGK
jgi:hypothetical protein